MLVEIGPAHLCGEPIGDPEVRADISGEFLDDVLAAARADDEAAVLIVMKHPDPPGSLADPHAGLIRRVAVPQSRRARIWLVWRTKADLPSLSMLTKAPSLITSLSRSDISRASHSNEIACAKRR